MRFLELVGVLSTDLLGHCIRSKAYGCCGALVSELGNAGSLHQLLTSDPSSYPSSVQYVPKLDFWRQNVMALAILLYEVRFQYF